MSDAAQPRVIVFHTLPSSGATLLARVLAALPDVVLLNEISPAASPFARFNALDPLEQALLRYPAALKFDAAARRRLFAERLRPVLEACAASGRTAILRDHSHSDFFGAGGEASSSLRTALAEHLADWRVDPFVLVRYPLSSYMTAKSSHFLDHVPTLDDYAGRYHQFLDVCAKHGPRLRYEDFSRFPERTLEGLCKKLDLVFDAQALRDFVHVSLSGSSGRFSGDRAVHPSLMRPLDPVVRGVALGSARHVQLCVRLRYPIDPVEYGLACARFMLDYDPNHAEAAEFVAKWAPLVARAAEKQAAEAPAPIMTDET